MLFKATVELFVDVTDATEAQDAVAEILRPSLRKYAPLSCLADWQYHRWQHTADSVPVPATESEIDQLEAN